MRVFRVRLTVRLLLVLVLVLGCVFGWLAHKARTQRRAVAQIKQLGGSVIYDFQQIPGVSSNKVEPRGPRWLRRLIGDELFQFGFALRIGGVHRTDSLRLAVEALDKRFGLRRKRGERGLDRGKVLLLNAQVFAESLDAFQERLGEGSQLGPAALIRFALDGG